MNIGSEDGLFVAKSFSARRHIKCGRTSMKYLQPDFLYVDPDGYDEFIAAVPELREHLPDVSFLTLDKMKNAVAVALEKFPEKIEEIRLALGNDEKGIIAVDIAESKHLSAEENAYWGVVLALSFTANVFHPSRDKLNQTHFTVYAAAPEKSVKLENLGVSGFAPESRLGFHTDGVINAEGVSLPRHLMLYNLMIGYKKPGCFYWVPFRLWEEKASFMKKVGIGKKYRIRVTPSVYEQAGGEMQVVTPAEVNVPIFLENGIENFPLYLNGEVVADGVTTGADVDLIQTMRDSIQNNETRYVVSQKTRRAIFACNTKGAHARDIFEEPEPCGIYTRVFIRAVDRACVALAVQAPDCQ